MSRRVRVDPEWLERQMAIRAWNQTNLARALGVSSQYVSQMKAKGDCGLRAYAKLHQAFKEHDPIPGLEQLLVEAGELEPQPVNGEIEEA